VSNEAGKYEKATEGKGESIEEVPDFGFWH